MSIAGPWRATRRSGSAELAETENVQLVVVGNKGMSGVRRFLGSGANKVAHEVPSDVLIVKTVDRSTDDLEPGHGGLVDAGGRQLAVFRDEHGQTYELSPRCTHMGCTVDWNDTAKTWDCPCTAAIRVRRIGREGAGRRVAGAGRRDGAGRRGDGRRDRVSPRLRGRSPRRRAT